MCIRCMLIMVIIFIIGYLVGTRVKSGFSPRTNTIVGLGEQIKDIGYETYKSLTGGGDPVEYVGVKGLAERDNLTPQAVENYVSGK